jgi:DNA-binding transcriptional regulator YiaG
MASVVFNELGFPIRLVNVRMVEVRGQQVPDVNMKTLQELVFRRLVDKPARLTGSEVRFIRKYLRLRQADLAEVLNMANHSVVSQWESRGDEATGMDYNTEVLLRLWMATRAGQMEQLGELLGSRLKNLVPDHRPLEVQLPRAA